MTQKNWIGLALIRHSLHITTAGTFLMLLQNVLFLSGLALLLVGISGGSIVLYSLYLDLFGIGLIGIGILLHLYPDIRTKRGFDKTHLHIRLGVISGVLCIFWCVLTIFWRILGLHGISSTADMISNLPPESIEFENAISSLFAQIQGVLFTWIVASLCLAVASIFFSYFLNARTRGEVKGIAWAFFCILNTIATIILAGNILGLSGGGIDFPLLASSIVLKIGTVPFFGIIAYAMLTVSVLGYNKRIGDEAAVKNQKDLEEDLMESDAST